MSNPLVSIVTVTYNAEKVLRKTLESANAQSYKNIELIIIDGGSTDGTLKIAQDFQSITGALVSEKDKGIYDAMNKGIRLAKGEWIFFLNAGDLFFDEHVLRDFFENAPLDDTYLLYGKVQTINEPTGINYINGSPVQFSDFFTRFPICHQAAFARKKAFELIGNYNLLYKMVADHEWFVRLFKQYPNRTAFKNRIVAYYDVQGTSYHKRMQSQKELLQYGKVFFPVTVWLTNYALYPFIWLKVWIIRNFQHTAFFKLYRKRKFARSSFQQQLPV
jgi:glycosyltransferase involved in cell wall biosynthesis